MFRKLAKHSDLMNGMARSAGLDLVEEVGAGRLAPADLRSALLTCTACASAGACQGFLEEGDGTPREVPSYCRNKALFDRLSGADLAAMFPPPRRR